MKSRLIGAIFGVVIVMPAYAQDVAVGETEFRKCKACHMIRDDSGADIVKGGMVGPNLWNIIGAQVASREGFRYGDGILAVASANPDLVWTQDELAAYVSDPTAWVQEKSGDARARSKMLFKLNTHQADLAAYLASLSPDAVAP